MNYANIYTQFCGVGLILLIIVMFLLQRKLSVRNEIYFLRCLIMNSILLVTDIVATMLKMWNPESIVTILFAKIWCIVLLVDLISIVLYVTGSIFSKKGYKKVFLTTIVSGIIAGILMMIAPIHVTYANGYIDTYGACIYFTFLCGAVTIAYIVYVSIKYRNRMSSDKPHIIRIWMGMWVIILLIQAILQHFLITSFGITLGLLIIFIRLETLDSYIDYKTGLFNTDALLKCLDDFKRYGVKTEVVYIKPSDYQNEMESSAYYVNPFANLNGDLRNRRKLITCTNKKDYVLILKKIDKKSVEELLKFYEMKGYLLAGYHAYYFQDASRITGFKHYDNIVKNVEDNGDVIIDVDPMLVEDYFQYQHAEEMIESAIEEDRVVVYYQPIYDMKTKKFPSAEALVRIVDKDGKLIPPGKFIPVAEKTGLVHKLDERVFNKVCQFISSHDLNELGLEYIEVNLSAVQLSDERLAQKYIGIMNDNNTDPTCINLEITESASLEKSNTLDINMRKLLDFNVSFSLDDYGTGYSNLNHIIKLPVSIIKFDKEMTDSYFKDDTAKYMMNYSIQMFHSMNLHIVIEGIETKEQLEEMEKLGVDYIQGYVFSKPIAEEEFVSFIKMKN